MNFELLQTLSQIIVTIGIIFTAIGGFGSYYFGQKIDSEKAKIQESRTIKEETTKATVGRLQPTEIKKIIDIKHNIYPKFEFGDSGAILIFAGPQGSPIFKFADDNNLIVSVVNGNISVSATIKDKQGSIVAEVIDNEWKINPKNSWDRNYSSNALEVKNASGEVVLQIKLVEDRIQFQGKLYDSNGRGIAFGKMLGQDGWGGGIEMTGQNHPNLEMKINPIFKYPSELHLGEFVAKTNQ